MTTQPFVAESGWRQILMFGTITFGLLAAAGLYNAGIELSDFENDGVDISAVKGGFGVAAGGGLAAILTLFTRNFISQKTEQPKK